MSRGVPWRICRTFQIKDCENNLISGKTYDCPRCPEQVIQRIFAVSPPGTQPINFRRPALTLLSLQAKFIPRRFCHPCQLAGQQKY